MMGTPPVIPPVIPPIAPIAPAVTPPTELTGWQGALARIREGLDGLGGTGGRLGGLASSINSMLNPLAQAGQSSGLVSSALQTFGVPAELAGSIGAIAPMLLGTLAVIGLVTAGFMSMMDGIAGVMDKASSLNDEVARTGIKAGDLMVMGEAFRTAGLSAGSAGMSIMFMNKALGDGDASTSKKSESFRKLGLDMDSLNAMQSVDKFKIIGSAINDLSSIEQKQAIAKDIFGRSGLRLLSLFSDPAAFEDASKMLGKNTKLMEENIDAFDKASDMMGGLMAAKMEGFFLSAGAQVIGPLQQILDMFATLDFNPIGTLLGQIMQPIMVIGGYLMALFVQLMDIVNLIVAIIMPLMSVLGFVFDLIGLLVSKIMQFYNSDSGLGGMIKSVIAVFVQITEEIDKFRKSFLSWFGESKEAEKPKKDIEKEDNNKAVVDSLQAIGGGGGVSSGADAGLSAAKTTADSTKATAKNTADIANSIRNGVTGATPEEQAKFDAAGQKVLFEEAGKKTLEAGKTGVVPEGVKAAAKEVASTAEFKKEMGTGATESPSLLGLPTLKAGGFGETAVGQLFNSVTETKKPATVAEVASVSSAPLVSPKVPEKIATPVVSEVAPVTPVVNPNPFVAVNAGVGNGATNNFLQEQTTPKGLTTEAVKLGESSTSTPTEVAPAVVPPKKLDSISQFFADIFNPYGAAQRKPQTASSAGGSVSSTGSVMAMGGYYNYLGGAGGGGQEKPKEEVATPFTGTDSSFSSAGGGFAPADNPDAPVLRSLAPPIIGGTDASGLAMKKAGEEREAAIQADKARVQRNADEALAKKNAEEKVTADKQKALFTMVNPDTGYSLEQEADQQLKTFKFNNSLTSNALGDNKFAQDGYSSSKLNTKSLVGVKTPTLTRKGDMNTFEKRFGDSANLVPNQNASKEAADAGGVVNPLTGKKESSGTGSPADKVQALLAKLVANTDPAKNQGVKVLMAK